MTAIFFASFGLAFSGAMMPGPLLTVTISESPRKGFITGPLLILGHAILEVALLALLLLGLAPLFSSPVFFSVISLAGGGILVWMGIGMLKSLPVLSVSWEGSGNRKNNLILQGILMSLANPYWTIWWATIGIGYILRSLRFGIPGIAVFFAGHILADLVWYSLVSGTISRGKKLFTDRVYRWLIGVCASFLLAFAIYFFISGIRKIAEMRISGL